MAPEHGVVERRRAVSSMRVGLDPAIEQEADDLSLTVSGGIPQRHLASRRVGGCDELLHDIEPSDSCRPNHPEAGATLGEVLRRLRASVGETCINCGDVVTG